MFSEFGKVEKAVILRDAMTGRSKKFGFVYMESIDDAQKAKEAMNDKEFNDRRMRVDYSLTIRPHSPTPGQYMGRPTERRDRYRNGSRSPSRRDRRDRDRSRSRDRYRSHRDRSRSRDRYDRDSKRDDYKRDDYKRDDYKDYVKKERSQSRSRDRYRDSRDSGYARRRSRSGSRDRR
ncbi:RNA-binding domain-containing protein [Gonapodya prolifera JEL478]|uniref:RNA-binding domain-containing protein n=1 Tax=Gonapodya prolifera (strain JEL478) TaxID=1344416 RepID=A0A139A0P4_GONPJ|nr:RNA-binding domain-containing protein [Gonapodya prolifera JEL478]|eukprot:KXS10331.1 RNA-binding domain-containing protein [Gonapodya prolifera JEL478]